MHDNHVGIKIKFLRKKRRLTQQELAQDICDRTTISHYENGQIEFPSSHILQAIAARLGVSSDELFHQTAHKEMRLSDEEKRIIEGNIRNKSYRKLYHYISSFVIEDYALLDRQYLYFAMGVYYQRCARSDWAIPWFQRAYELTNRKKNDSILTSLELRIRFAWVQSMYAKNTYSQSCLYKKIQLLEREWRRLYLKQESNLSLEMANELIKMYLAIDKIIQAESIIKMIWSLVDNQAMFQNYWLLLITQAELAYRLNHINEAKQFIHRALCLIEAIGCNELLDFLMLDSNYLTFQRALSNTCYLRKE